MLLELEWFLEVTRLAAGILGSLLFLTTPCLASGDPHLNPQQALVPVEAKSGFWCVRAVRYMMASPARLVAAIGDRNFEKYLARLATPYGGGLDALERRTTDLVYFARRYLDDPRVTPEKITEIALANAEVYWLRVWDEYQNGKFNEANEILTRAVELANDTTLAQIASRAKQYQNTTDPNSFGKDRYDERTHFFYLDLLVESVERIRQAPREVTDFLLTLEDASLGHLVRVRRNQTQIYTCAGPLTSFEAKVFPDRSRAETPLRTEILFRVYSRRRADVAFQTPASGSFEIGSVALSAEKQKLMDFASSGISYSDEKVIPRLQIETSDRFFGPRAVAGHSGFSIAHALHYLLEGRVALGLNYSTLGQDTKFQRYPMKLYLYDGAAFVVNLAEWMHANRRAITDREKSEIVGVLKEVRSLVAPTYSQVFVDTDPEAAVAGATFLFDAFGTRPIQGAVDAMNASKPWTVRKFFEAFDSRIVGLLDVTSVAELDTFLGQFVLSEVPQKLALPPKK